MVIGILIALSINNWKQNRKNQDSERIVLTNIQNDISQDTLDLGFNRSIHKKALKNEILLYGLLNKDPRINADSINYSGALTRVQTLHSDIEIELNKKQRTINKLKLSPKVSAYLLGGIVNLKINFGKSIFT